MTFLSKKLEIIFQMILKSSEPRTDGGHFSRFTSLPDLMKSIHTDLSSTSSDYHEMDRIQSVLLIIWDDWLMKYSNVPSLYNKYHEQRGLMDRSDFELIIRSIIRTFLIQIHEIVPRMYDFQQDTYRENRELIKLVLKIGIELPLEEMFEISQTRPDFPIRIRVYHDEVDRFINVYLWVILILLKEGYQYNFEDGHLEDDFCSICCDTSSKDIVRIAGGCSHSYCRSCLSRTLTLQNRCPTCRREYTAVDISDPCNQAVAVFLEERRKRDKAVVQMKSNEKRYLTQFLETRGVDMSKVDLWRGSNIRAFSTCGNLYTIGWKGTHKCGPNGALHHATKHVGMASLCILRPTKCCLNCEGVFNAYRDCGHIVCDAHLGKDQRCCPECSKLSWIFELKLPEQKIGE
jgi:hypothetical protein